MAESTTIGDVVDAAAQNGELTSDDVRELFANISGLTGSDIDDAWDQVEDALLAAIPNAAGLQVRPGGWVLDLRDSAVRAVLAAALIGGVMWPAGLHELPGYVLPAVLPLLVDVRKARLTRSDKRLLVELRLSQTLAQAPLPWPAPALYGRLPAQVQARVSPEDFADFLDRLMQVGVADPASSDEVLLRPADRPVWFRLSTE